MKIIQTIAGLSASAGGPSTCTYDLIKHLHLLDCQVDLLTIANKSTKVTDILLGEGENWVKALNFDYKTPFAISQNLKSYLIATDYDIYHTNGLWMYCNHITSKVARKKGKPFVLSPHGMLYPAAIRRSYWKKWPLLQLFFKKDIMGADCIHVTCMQELYNVRLFGYKGPIAVIPNPVVIPHILDNMKPTFPKCSFGFLGRLHPVKNIPNIFQAIKIILDEQPDLPIKLQLMGGGDAKYESFLHEEVNRLGIENVVDFVGFVTGDEKYKRLSQLTALVVPSEFENFGMIVPEALCCQTPVIASLGTPWEELNTHHCGYWIDKSPASLAKSMLQMIFKSEDELRVMGQNGLDLVKSKYGALKVAEKMEVLYKWMIEGGTKPKFVYVD